MRQSTFLLTGRHIGFRNLCSYIEFCEISDIVTTILQLCLVDLAVLLLIIILFIEAVL